MALPAGHPDFVLSLARGLQVIEAFHEKTGWLTVSEVAERTGLSRAAVRRLLITLESLGYAEHKDSQFRLTRRILRLGFAFISSSSLASLSLPILEQLSAHIRESASVSLLDGTEIVYLARSAPKRVMTIDLGVGSRLPAYCTSMGRVLLGSLPQAELERWLRRAKLTPLTTKTICEREELLTAIRQVRTHGYALVDEELELGLRSIAVPVISQTGRVAAAMNSGVHAARVSCLDLVEHILPPLRDHARMLGQMLP